MSTKWSFAMGMAAGLGMLLGLACTSKVSDADGDGGAGGTASGSGGETSTSTSSGTGGGSTFVPLQPEEGVATDITLAIYSDGWGTLLETLTVATEGPVTISVEETDPYTDPPQYYIYASADGFYTELYSCIKDGSIDVDLDAVPERSDAVAGVIFAQQGYFADSYLSDTTIAVDGAGVQTTLTTDAQGRYGLEGLPLGSYTLSFPYQDETITLQVTNGTAGTDYEDLFFAEPMQAS